MNWKEGLRDYFYFSRKDRLGLIVLLSLILIVSLAPKFIPRKPDPVLSPADSGWISAMKRIEAQNDDDSLAQTTPTSGNRASAAPTALFYFDPNHLSDTAWRRLGLRERTIGTIRHYLEKGGRFHTARDLQKIYGMHEQDYRRLAPFVRIPESPGPENHTVYSTRRTPPARFQPVEINKADSLQWVSLPGIGPTLASRIIRFRDKLGGFHTIHQLAETYGLPDSTFRKLEPFFRVVTGEIRQLEINTSTESELKAHPYIPWNVARTIVAYRAQHGAYRRLDDLKNIVLIDDSLFARIAPYLKVESPKVP